MGILADIFGSNAQQAFSSFNQSASQHQGGLYAGLHGMGGMQNATIGVCNVPRPRSMRATIAARKEQAMFFRRSADAADADVIRMQAEDAALTAEYGPEAAD